MPTPDQLAALAGSQIDIGFVRLPITKASVEMRPILRERLVLAFGTRSPWRPRGGLDSVAVKDGKPVPVMSPLPLPIVNAAKTGAKVARPRGSTAVTTVRTGPLPTSRLPSPDTSVVSPTPTPCTSVVALSR